jgi:isopropylmalate/homocitrate/citramalate synthase
MIRIPPTLNADRVLTELQFEEHGRWAIPALNRSKDVDPVVAPQKVILKDDTFRESTNMPGASPTNDRKLELARVLAQTGVKEIVGGHAGLKDQCDFMRMVKQAGLDLMVHAYVDFGDWKRGIDNAVAADADGVWMPGALNPSPVFAGKLGARYGYWSADFDLSAVLDTVKAAVDVAKEKGKFVTVARAPMIPEIFEKALEAYVKAGADRIVIFDDRGNYTPQTMAYVVKRHREIVGPDVQLEVHCHDDFGLALANTLEAVRAGADVVDCVLNGYSHRSGNCALEQIAPALEVLYGVHTGVDLSRLTSLCQLAADVFGVPIYPQAPHVGAWAYSYGGVHISALLQEGWFVWETMQAETIGQHRHVAWTPTALERHGMAGPVALKLRHMGYEFNEAQLQQVFDGLRKVMAPKKFATDEEFEAVARDVLSK